MKLDSNDNGGLWSAGNTPVAVIMISQNEGHNMKDVLDNLKGFAQEVFLVDSYSQDETVDIALKNGVYVVQRPFRNFGDQWNFALCQLPITALWTMKLDPDERLTEELKANLHDAIMSEKADGISLVRRLWWMGRPMPVCQSLVRVWRTGRCRFTEVAVNEHPIIEGLIINVPGYIEHHDSPDLEHWLEKQNRYTTDEAIIACTGTRLADEPRLLGNPLQRRMWLKKKFYRIPFRYSLFFLYCYLCLGSWRAGWIGYAWARLRTDYMRLIEYKCREMKITRRVITKHHYGRGKPDIRVKQYD